MKFVFTLILTIASLAFVHAQTYVTSATTTASSGAGRSWSPPTFATSSGPLNMGNPNSATLTASGFDFSGIPVTASITGFTVTVNRRATASITDFRISIVKGGVIQSDNKATATNWPGTAGNATYGNSSDLWGGSPWTVADLNASFGVAIAAIRTSGTGSAFVNAVQVTVHYNILAPIILTSFDVSRTAENHVIINWATSTEDKVKMMYIERSTDGRNFTTIFTITPAGARNKYTRYSVTDKTPAQGTNYYRLKETDFDGNLYYFDIKSVSISAKMGSRFQAYYNGADIKVNVAGLKGRFTLSLYDAGGHLLNSQQVNINSGTHQALISSPGRSGIYFVNVRGEGVSETAKIFVGK